MIYLDNFIGSEMNDLCQQFDDQKQGLNCYYKMSIEEMENELIPLMNENGKSSEITVRIKAASYTKKIVKTWTPEQDKLLFQLYDKYPKNWIKISEEMGHRNVCQCLHRHRRLTQVGEQKRIWSPEEDDLVLKMVSRYGNNWKMISSELKTKTGKQIRQRYINKLDPSIKRQQWTQSQDLKLIRLYSKYGPHWSQISKALSGRPENKIKNRFYSYIQKNYEIIPSKDEVDKEALVNDTAINRSFSEKPQEDQSPFNSPISKKPLMTGELQMLCSISDENKQNSKVDSFLGLEKQNSRHPSSESKQGSLKEINEANIVNMARDEDFLYFED